MSKEKHLPGITRVEEESKLAEVLTIAERNLTQARKAVKVATGDLHELQETFNENDKETQMFWNNAKASLQFAKEELRRSEKARKKPYFGRIDFIDDRTGEEEAFYIGRVGIQDTPTDRAVIDWRAPVATVYYEESLGKCKYNVRNVGDYNIDLTRKRTYEIAEDKLVDFYDSEVVANDDLLTKYLAKTKKAVLGEIIATIQKEQNLIIRKSPRNNILVQGVAGSGKTTVAMHRISYILYNYENEFKARDFYIVGSNRILLNYITSVLPDLDVYGISQMTMEQLFTRLLYEDWDRKKYSIRSLTKEEEEACIKGSYQWFRDLEKYCEDYELSYIPHEEVRTYNTDRLLLSKEEIETYIRENNRVSVQNKVFALNERVLARLDNEIIGRGVSYTKEDKIEMIKFYRFYFGKKLWKGSIFEMYKDFLKKQQVKGAKVKMPGNELDVYDLAALAYLYKRIKETELIVEASHVVIDEAQDFGMMAYASLEYCLRNCTYTIMGDVSQNIHFGYGLNDWEELKGLILRNKFDTFGLLKKSYRNTVEISNFATGILRHGSFAIYPVEPILRHGDDVRVTKCENEQELLDKTVSTIEKWQQEGHETIAIVCREEEEAKQVTKALRGRVQLVDSNLETAEFGNGVMVLPVEYTKGLEFDAVLLYNPTKEQYPYDDGHVKLLYVAATRALHDLVVLHNGNLTDLIGLKVEDEKVMDSLVAQEKTEKTEPKKPVDTNRVRKSTMGSKVDLLAGDERRTGPKRIQVQGQQPSKKTEERPVIRKQDKESNLEGVVYSGHKFLDVPDSTKLRPAGHVRIDTSIRFIRKNADSVELASRYGILRITPVDDAVIRVSFQKGQADTFDHSVEWLHEEPTPSCVQAGLLMKKPKWLAKETKDAVGIATEKLVVKIEKKSGAVKFYTRDGKLLLAEREKEPRLIEDEAKRTWMFFDWKKKEKIWARGMASEELFLMDMKARYISYGKKKMRMPFVVSDSGYGIGVASKSAVMCCNIPVHGTYLSVEESSQIDYYFLYGGSAAGSIAMHKIVAKQI